MNDQAAWSGDRAGAGRDGRHVPSDRRRGAELLCAALLVEIMVPLIDSNNSGPCPRQTLPSSPAGCPGAAIAVGIVRRRSYRVQRGTGLPTRASSSERRTAHHLTEPVWAASKLPGAGICLSPRSWFRSSFTRGSTRREPDMLARLRANATARRSSYPIVTKIRADPAIPREHPTLSARPPLT